VILHVFQVTDNDGSLELLCTDSIDDSDDEQEVVCTDSMDDSDDELQVAMAISHTLAASEVNEERFIFY